VIQKILTHPQEKAAPEPVWLTFPPFNTGCCHPKAHGRRSAGLPAGMDCKVALAREDISMARTEWSRISAWWRGARPFVTRELIVVLCGKGCLSFLYDRLPPGRRWTVRVRVAEPGSDDGRSGSEQAMQ
jgi:hypothetical protein